MRSLGFQTVISSLCIFKFSGTCSSLSNSNVSSIRYCLNKCGVCTAEIAPVSQTSQSFWGVLHLLPCSPRTAEINILPSVNPLFPFSPGLYQLCKWRREGGRGCWERHCPFSGEWSGSTMQIFIWRPWELGEGFSCELSRRGALHPCSHTPA